jgi:hypothetical protein
MAHLPRINVGCPTIAAERKAKSEVHGVFGEGAGERTRVRFMGS